MEIGEKGKPDPVQSQNGKERPHETLYNPFQNKRHFNIHVRCADKMHVMDQFLPRIDRQFYGIGDHEMQGENQDQAKARGHHEEIRPEPL
jgi:hypothetical protein